ncbi:MAG: hypothetical protein ACN4GM_00725 [Gammaproteobacteria bacterium]
MELTTSQDLNTNDHRHVVTGGVLLTWLSLIVVLGLNEVFVTAAGEPPLAILISMATSISLFSIAYLSFPAVRDYVLKLDMRFLIMLHSWRMLGMAFIMLHLFGHLPSLFAYLAGLGDALTAILAVFLAYSLVKAGEGVSKKTIWRWNTFGLVDFIIAVSVGILTRTDAILAPATGVNSDIMTVFPFVIIPGFLVQLFTLTHIIIYLQLKNNHRHDSQVKID